MYAAPIATSCFSKLADVARDRAADIAAFVASGYSFESWLLWEWAARCWREPTWHTQVEPRYTRDHDAGDMARGDLLVRMGDAGVLVELALMHDWTGGKWYASDGKLACDRAKLSRCRLDRVDLLQVILIASKGAIAGHAGWQRALARSTCWNTTPTMTESVVLPPSGEVAIFGWLVDRAGADASSVA